MSRRVESKVSRTAMFTCMFRGAFSLETDPHLHSNDHIAFKLLPRTLQLLFKSKYLRHWIIHFGPNGAFEYVIARTKYIDELVCKAQEMDFSQALIFGVWF